MEEFSLLWNINDSLGGIKFGIDGGGNYGYYGADDSLIPFSNGTYQITITGQMGYYIKSTSSGATNSGFTGYVSAINVSSIINITINGTNIDMGTPSAISFETPNIQPNYISVYYGANAGTVCKLENLKISQIIKII